MKKLIRVIPNLLSIFRLISPLFIIFYYINNEYISAFIIFIMAAISDFLDGFIARRFSVTSKIGAVLDPLADKSLIISIYALLAAKGDLFLSLSVFVILRDVLILLCILYMIVKKINIEFKPLYVSRINTTAQLILILAVLVLKIVGIECKSLINIISTITCFLTIYSGYLYLIRFTRICREMRDE